MALALLAGAILSPSAAQGEQAISASSFTNAIGVNTHFAYGQETTNVNQTANFPQINKLLMALGIQHIRDGLVCGFADNSSGFYDQELQFLASNGIHTALNSSPRGDLDAQTPNMALNSILSLNATSNVVESIEGPNELDCAGDYTYDGNSGFPSNVIAYQRQLFNAFKGNRKTANLVVIGPSEGKTYGSTGPNQNPLAAGSLYNYCDVGNFHPYCYGGNFATQHYTYDSIKWYYGQANTPSVNIDPNSINIAALPYAFQVNQPPFALYNSSGKMTTARPMYATEKGYFNGTATQSVSAATLAKYIPRMFADDMVAGIARTYCYELLDEAIYSTSKGVTTAATDPTNCQENFGLIAVNSNGTLSPKPAYYTLQHMIQLLDDTGTAKSTESLNYKLSYTPPSAYATADPNYWGIPTTIQHLLLQKSNGMFELLLWNDVSSAAIADTSGNALASTARDIAVPKFPLTLTFTTRIKPSVTLYGLNPYGTTLATTLDTTRLSMVNDQITINVPDYVTIVEITPVP